MKNDEDTLYEELERAITDLLVNDTLPEEEKAVILRQARAILLADEREVA